MESNVKAWCVGFLNTDFTDNLLENTEFFVIAWCVGFLNTDYTDYTDIFFEDVDILC